MQITRFGTADGLNDLRDDAQKNAWSYLVDYYVTKAADEAQTKQFYSPITNGFPPANQIEREIIWSAFPSRQINERGRDAATALSDLDLRWYELGETATGAPVFVLYRNHTEYCEWRVDRDTSGRIKTIRFTAEPWEYWWSLANGYPLYGRLPSNRPAAPVRLNYVLEQYQQYVSPKVRLEDICFTEDVYQRRKASGQLVRAFGRGDYNPWNRWNTTDGLLHLTMPANSLQAFIVECARVCVPRTDGGALLREGQRAIAALDNFRGALNDYSGRAIAAVVGQLARAGSLITTGERPAVTMRSLDTRGWSRVNGQKLPDAKTQSYWKPLRGIAGRAVLADFDPSADGLFVNDLETRQGIIRYGAQVAANLTLGFPIVADKFASTYDQPRPAEGYATREVLAGSVGEAPANQPVAPNVERLFPHMTNTVLPPIGTFNHEPLLDASDIQGNILAGFKQDHQRIWGFNVTDARKARAALAACAGGLATLGQVATHNACYDAANPTARAWYNVALSYAGMLALRVPGVEEFESPAFRRGVAGGPFTQNLAAEPDVFLIGAADTDAAIDALPVAEWARRPAHFGLALMYEHRGASLQGREHFGFKDSISQPGVRGRLNELNGPLTPRLSWNRLSDPRYLDHNEPEYAQPGHVLLWPGEFVLGYPRQSSRHPRWPEPAQRCAPAWSRYGSFLVYLKLKQDVAAFDLYAWTLAQQYKIPVDLAAAQLVGRWKDGSPLVQFGAPAGVPNNHFLFGDDSGLLTDGTKRVESIPSDPQGARCPFSAHIRKVNPRDDTTETGGVSDTLRHRILRRGIPYGPAYPGHADGVDRGLLFLCYQASIENQFEVLWGSWLGDPIRPAAGGAEQLVTAPFVQLLEGGYFFSPAISSLR